MVQTKLSVAFILAAVAIAPIIAVPLRAAYPEQIKSVLYGMTDDGFVEFTQLEPR